MEQLLWKLLSISDGPSVATLQQNPRNVGLEKVQETEGENTGSKVHRASCSGESPAFRTLEARKGKCICLMGAV